jgi:bacterioferritin (cytochrome b1)|tara:strand:+ start:891 stop:1181 length:291 start_codon:yes stop_codon:yes gene_type:complete
LEPVLPVSIVLGIAGGALSAAVTLGRKFETIESKQEGHVASIEKRMDTIELRLAQDYVDKTDLQNILERLDARIDRMDYKLDQILIGYNKTAPPQI